MNANYIRTKQHIQYNITKKFCEEKIKKFVKLNNEIIIYIFEKGNNFYYFNINENGFDIKTKTCNFKIKDIYILKDNIFILEDINNNLNNLTS